MNIERIKSLAVHAVDAAENTLHSKMLRGAYGDPTPEQVQDMEEDKRDAILLTPEEKAILEAEAVING